MPATSFTFYGLVERAENPTGDFQFSNGQTVLAHLALSGAAASLYEDIFDDETEMELTSNVGVDIDFEGRDMFFPEELVIRSNGTDLSIVEMAFIGIHIDNDEENPPGSLFFRVNQFGDGGAQIVEEEGNGDSVGFQYGKAWIAGAWIPDDITPNLVYGTAAGETLNAVGEVSMLWGMDGNDTLWGSQQSFYGFGGDGNDSLRGSREEDQLFGGLGDDFVEGGRGADYLNGLDGNDTVMGGEGEDTLSGGNGDDSLSGGKEDDRLEGSRGNDTLHGNTGDDTLIGGDEGGDSLEGGQGDDLLHGAHMRGGSGEDVFRFYVEFGSAAVYDFKNGEDHLEAKAVPFGVDVMSLAAQVGANVEFVYEGQTVLTLLNFKLSQLDSSDFVH